MLADTMVDPVDHLEKEEQSFEQMLLDEDFFSFKGFKGNAPLAASMRRVRPDQRQVKSFTKKVAENRVNVMKNFDFDDEVMSDNMHISTDSINLKLRGDINSIQKHVCKTSDEEKAQHGLAKKTCVSSFKSNDKPAAALKKDLAQQKSAKFFDKSAFFCVPSAS